MATTKEHITLWIKDILTKIEEHKTKIVQLETYLKAIKSTFIQSYATEWSTGILPCVLLTQTVCPTIHYSQLINKPTEMLQNLQAYLKEIRYNLTRELGANTWGTIEDHYKNNDKRLFMHHIFEVTKCLIKRSKIDIKLPPDKTIQE